MPLSNTDYDALAATMSIEDMAEDGLNQATLRSLKDDDADLCHLGLCSEDMAGELGDYYPGSSEELGWLGHFAKKSTHLITFGLCGDDIFKNCSQQSVERFFQDIGQCNRIKKMHCWYTDMSDIIEKLGPVVENNDITHWDMQDCILGVPGASYLFNAFQNMKSLKELSICYDDEDVDHGVDDDIMSGCIPSLAGCTAMQTLNLGWLGLSTSSCAALSAIFPRMASLHELKLVGNSMSDDCVEILVGGLAECKHLHSLRLDSNRISDDGLDVLIRRLPASVSCMGLSDNQVTLARKLPLLRFKQFALPNNTFYRNGNPLSLKAPRVIAASLANPECFLEVLDLCGTNIGNKGAAILAESLRNNRRLTVMNLGACNITNKGRNAFLSVLCDTTNINATHGSNHTLQRLGFAKIHKHVKAMLELNFDQVKSRVAAKKILQSHRHLDMRPLFGWELGLLPNVVEWLERFAESRLDLKLSSIFEFVTAMPMNVVGGVGGKTIGKKRKRDLLPYAVTWLERFAEPRLDINLASILEFVRAMPMNIVDGVVGKKRKRNST